MSNVPSVPFLLSEDALEDLEALIKYSDHIEPVVTASESKRPTGSVFSFSSVIAKETNLSAKRVRDILLAIWNIKRLADSKKLGPSDTIDAISDFLERESDEDWRTKFLSGWKEVRDLLVRSLERVGEDHPLLVSQKAQSLAYAHQNILMSARLITDMRPVFDAKGEKILETVIVHTLSIQYATGHTPPSVIDFALDADDVASLCRACHRAEEKTKIVARAIQDLNPVVLPDGGLPS